MFSFHQVFVHFFQNWNQLGILYFKGKAFIWSISFAICLPTAQACFARCIYQNSFGFGCLTRKILFRLSLYVVFASSSHCRFLRWAKCSFRQVFRKCQLRQRWLAMIIIPYHDIIANAHLTEGDGSGRWEEPSQGRFHNLLLVAWKIMIWWSGQMLMTAICSLTQQLLQPRHLLLLTSELAQHLSRYDMILIW